MFVDKSAPSTVTVARVSRFFSVPGVKNSDTVATVDSSSALRPTKVYPDGHVIELQTSTGTWYYNMRLTDPSVLGWTKDLSKAYIFRPSAEPNEERAQGMYDDLVSLVGTEAIISVRHRPVRKVPIGRCEIIEG